jgi:glutamate synthase (NADPH) large chain
MSGGIAYVWDPKGRFKSLCNLTSVDTEPVLPVDLAEDDDPNRPRQRSASVDDAGMGDLLRFDAARLRILLERHLLFTGSARARELLEDWESAVAGFVKIMPKDYRRALLELQAERQAASLEARAMTASADG